MKVTLVCCIVGDGRVIVDVIGSNKLVGILKNKIKKENPSTITCDAKDLQLFPAKQGNQWLGSRTEDGEAVKQGRETSFIEDLLHKDNELHNDKILEDTLLKDMPNPSDSQIHVLVKISRGITMRIKEDSSDQVQTDELQHYQRRGGQIQRNCGDYCAKILDKIDQLYEESTSTFPFICVEGSSGMGKSQLAFALNFERISNAFNEVTRKDNPVIRAESDILISRSLFYLNECLWTYGFILALLKHSEKQDAHMIRFEEEKALEVEPCDLSAVKAARAKMIAKKKNLPFFILDEMSLNENKDGERNLAAFQLNVFRVCELVVIVMGTDVKVSTNMISQYAGSRVEPHMWMTIVSRFPPYQPIPLDDDAMQDAWENVTRKHPVILDIAKSSRGRFTRIFVNSVVNSVMETPDFDSINLCDLLDEAFHEVSFNTEKGKGFMGNQLGIEAQMMAISYTNATDINANDDTFEPVLKTRKIDVGATCMNVHFANLIDEQNTDVKQGGGDFSYIEGYQWVPYCRFPKIEEDLLLYLAVLGGKAYSGYYEHTTSQPYSTCWIFQNSCGGNGYQPKRYLNAWSNDDKKFENMVAHVVFCASRRNGVQGIDFDQFFAALLGEFQDELFQPMPVKLSGNAIFASELLEGYAALKEKFAGMKIPFLAPPNAEWPKCILEAGGGCSFGHLVRAKDKKRLGCYVKTASDEDPLFVCECKHWQQKLDSGAMERIIDGLNTPIDSHRKPNWNNWVLALVFCQQFTNFQDGKEEKLGEVGCVVVDCKSGEAEWINQPKETREKLVIVMQTGPAT
ncbi:Crinkler (CRN) family protein [Phytophthora palmivora]|uniref:Crinkler (CRN) family protein n=1 Tax=Phytophthora palmivora TaxID=4796 RepID=A0A2P4Y687_9STRA|nr:Crinkler (CRN) family protein [Phytophthora palmivora]